MRFLLYPFSLLYGLVTGVRNFLFDKGLLRSTTVGIPTICIGNLTVGGTGKTPHTEYVLSLLQKQYKTAMLSRGYKRSTKGFVLATPETDSDLIGDEPYQIHRKFPDVAVAVDERRVHGVHELTSRLPHLQAIVLDDAYQHRAIRAGYSVLLTDYARLYTRDCLLPAGRLREGKRGSRRAHCIVVSKCPPDITADEMHLIRTEIAPQAGQEVFFSCYRYLPLKAVFPEGAPGRGVNNDTGVLLVAGIVAPQPIVTHLRQYTEQIETLFFADHHNFTEDDLDTVYKKFNALNISEKIIVVTEKDAARLLSNPYYPDDLKPLTYALPIEVKFLEGKDLLFTQKIEDYVKENSRNG